jgi:hypothetical protein
LLVEDGELVLRIIEVRLERSFVGIPLFDVVRNETEEEDDDPIDEEGGTDEPELTSKRERVW